MAVLPPTSSSYLDLTISIPGSSGDSGEGRSMRNLDINQVPEVEGGEDREWRTTLSMNNHYNSSAEDDVDGGASSPPRKKLRLSKEQSRHLEESFRRNQTLNPKQKEELAMELKLKARQVEVWFQNRRARSKLKQTEMECEYLKRWFGSLTERNRRLQKEVEQLRALRSVGPSAAAAAHSQAGAALTMCPRCERVATTNPPKGNSFSATSSAHVASATASVTASGKLPERSNLLSAATRQASSSAAC